MQPNLLKDILQWDVKSWSKAIDYWEKNTDFEPMKNCLELGSREGGLTLFLALKGKKVVCSDLQNTQQTASPLHGKYMVSALVSYADIDATEIPYENHWDVIIFKSIIGGIGSNDNKERQQMVFQQIHKALKPGGKLLFAENLAASPLHRLFRKKFVKWGSYWCYVSVDEMADFLSIFAKFDLKTTGVLAAFGRNEKQRRFLAAVDLLLHKICPRSWRYIGYGCAEK